MHFFCFSGAWAMKPADRYRLALCLSLITFTQALTPVLPETDKEISRTDLENTERLLNIASGTEAESDDVMLAHEPADLETLMTGFKNNMAQYSGVGDREVRKNLNEMLYDFHHPLSDRYNNEYTHFSKLCRRLLEKEHVQTRVRRTTGHLPKLAIDMELACKDFLEQPSEQNLERVEDLDAEMLQEVLCLERGMSVGVERSCRSQYRGVRSVFEGEASETDIDEGLPSNEEIDDFNDQLFKYCPERQNYDHNRVRRSASTGAMFSADMLEYMDCHCDNRTNCGHLAFKVGKSFREDIAEPVALQLGEGLEQGNELEKEAAKEIQETQFQFVAPGNNSYQEALKDTEHLLSTNRRKKRAFKRYDVVKIPMKELVNGIGCAIVIHRDRPIQVFACTLYKVLKIELKLIWTNILPRIELNIKACLPVVSDILDFVTKYVKPLNDLLKKFDIENGCLLIAKAYVDFYKGVFEILSNVPQINLILFRAKLRSSLLIRFDTSRPTDNEKERERLNIHGSRTYIKLQSTFRIEYFEIWKAWWGGWQCMWCKTLIDKVFPLGSDKRPLSDDTPPPPGYRFAEEKVKGTGRLEVEISGVLGTVCDDGFDEYAGELWCRTLGFNGYIGLWDDVPPGEGEIHLGSLKCTGTEAGLADCPREKDVGATGCEHTEDVGVRCLTEDSGPCHQAIHHGILTASSGDPSNMYFDSTGGWQAGSAADAWVMIELYFNHKISGIRTMAHKTAPNWVTEFRVHVYNDTWNFNKDPSGNEKVYKGNFDATSIKSNFWWPPLRGTQVKIFIDKYNNQPAMRMEIHGCSTDSMLMENAVTYQSSVLMGGFSRLALDGNTDTDFRQGSCSHTAEERNPWWAVDMGKPMRVEGLRVTNRGDCCGNRLNDFTVEVGNKLSLENGADGEVCFTHPNTVPDGGKKIMLCVGTPKGRFVQIRKRGYGILSLCEVEIWAQPAAIDSCDAAAENKVDCGSTDQAECEANGCCWNPGSSPKCYSINTMIPPDSDCRESLFVHEPRTDVSVSSTHGDNPDGTKVDGEFGPSRSRLDTLVNAVEGPEYAHGGWKAGTSDEHQYIQVTFPEIWSVREIVTQGANNDEEWVVRYRVYVSYDGNYWTQVGGIMEANSDSDSKAVNEFQVFAAKMIRINPIESHIFPSLRFEIFGCKDCLISLFSRDPNTRYIASSYYKRDLKGYGPERGRLGTMEEASPYKFGGWKAEKNEPKEFIAVVFGGPRRVRAVIIEPAQGKEEYVKRYAVYHQPTPVGKPQLEGEYPGCPDAKTSVTNFIKNPFTAVLVKLEVIEFFGAVSMRFEVLGCDVSMSDGLMKKYTDLGHTDLRPSVFYVEETVASTEAEAKCKEHGAKLANMNVLRQVYDQKNFEMKCTYGFASSMDGNVIGATLNMFDHSTEGCSSPGALEVPDIPATKLLGVFCSPVNQGLVFRELKACSLTSARYTCFAMECRLANYYESTLATEYTECRIGYYQDSGFYPVIGNICDRIPTDYSGRTGFQPDESRQSCASGVYCFVPPLTLGMMPPAYIRLRLLRPMLDYLYVHGDKYSGAIMVADQDPNEYTLGHMVGEDMDEVVKHAPLVAMEPMDSGILTPAVSFEEITGDGCVFLHPICPAGYHRVGDIFMKDDMPDDQKNQLRSNYRCVREDFLIKCTNQASFNDAFFFKYVEVYRHYPLPGQSSFSGAFFTAAKYSDPKDAYCILIGVSSLSYRES